jgi:hypothetical protein
VTRSTSPPVMSRCTLTITEKTMQFKGKDFWGKKFYLFFVEVLLNVGCRCAFKVWMGIEPRSSRLGAKCGYHSLHHSTAPYSSIFQTLICALLVMKIFIWNYSFEQISKWNNVLLRMLCDPTSEAIIATCNVMRILYRETTY